jgi:translation initiation factor 2 alpha subunit (eIF-2alpha)
MTIINYSVQQILRTYHQHLNDKSRLSKEKGYKRVVQQDAVSISQESKKKLLTDKITQEIMNQFLSGEGRNETMQAIMNRLSQEYGKPLDVSSDNEQHLVFKVLHKENGGETGDLSPAANEELKKRLFDITKSTVYDNLI